MKVIAFLSQVEELDEIYCYCSNPLVKEYLTDRVQFLQRSTDLDTPVARRNDILRAFLSEIKTDLLVLSHVTSPFLKAETVSKCVSMVESGEYDSALAAVKLQEFLWLDGKSYNFDSANMPRSQELPKIYKETCGCLVLHADQFLETGNYVGVKPFVCEVGEIESIDIDYQEDFDIANAIYMTLFARRGGGIKF